ncbi:hypothetical protein ABMA27_010082 [Loxostege sticticalis]|uniref:Serine protease K12H4.7 n=1 Tax=Loxostege sticticalis TaxID=481309 RepID=A0ABR3H4I5_LOXSC
MWRLLFLLAPALGFQLNREPPPPAASSRASFDTRWLDVRLNHFDATNTDTFPMRFFFNPREANASNIVIFVGGEWEITPGWVTGGLAYNIAEYTDASLFYTEHRYYGLTRPTNGTSVPELRFLTIDQALADLAQFITYVKSDAFEQGRFRNAKVLLVGCSYAGTMATWMRVQYPHLIDGSFSDSGPLHAQEDFPEYLKVVGDAISSQGGQSCYTTIAEAVSEVTEMLNTTGGRNQVTQIFNTCELLSPATLDIATFHWVALIYPFAALVQGASPGDIPEMCEQLTSGNSTAVERLGAWVRAQHGTPCLETRYLELVDQYTNTSFDAEAATMRAWMYQTCVEYGWYQTTNGGPHQPFGSGVPLEYFLQMCRDFFSPFFDAARLSYGVRRTNLFYGGPSQIPDKVVSVAGQFDPWNPMGPNETHSRPQAPVYFVPDISHCRIIYAVNDSETDSVADVKMRVIRHMNAFAFGAPAPDSAARVVSSVVLLLGVVVSML